MAPKIDKSILIAYMNKYTMTVAAKKLCIGMTSLKKHCRNNDIARWQYRQNASYVNKLKRKISKLDILYLMSKTTLINAAKWLGVKKHILKELCKAYSIDSWNRSQTIFTLCTIKCNSKDVDSLMTTNEMLQEFGDTLI